MGSPPKPKAPPPPPPVPPVPTIEDAGNAAAANRQKMLRRSGYLSQILNRSSLTGSAGGGGHTTIG